MPTASPVYISGAVEGGLDEAVLLRLITEAGVRIKSLPITPEKVLRAIKEKKGEPEITGNSADYHDI